LATAVAFWIAVGPATKFMIARNSVKTEWGGVDPLPRQSIALDTQHEIN
jgi:hypothetical protein